MSQERREELRTEFGWPALWIPRALGLVVLLLVGWGLCRTWRNMRGAAEALGEADAAAYLSLILLFVLIAVIAIFGLLVWRRRVWIATAKEACLDGRTPIFARWLGPVPPPQKRTRTDIFIAWARGFIGFVAVVAILFPQFTSAFTPRLFFVPLLFSGVVLFLGEIASWSHRLRTPLLLMIVVISVVSVNNVERYHDVRWVKGRPASAADERQISFDEAVARWKRANHCSNPTEECPRPILIAGAGGASRAAFLTASVIGALLDLDSDPDNSPTQNEHSGSTLRSRIFAMSTVSGSSVGAAVIRAALTDAQSRGKPDTPPSDLLISDGVSGVV
jgi:hypothetical protein